MSVSVRNVGGRGNDSMWTRRQILIAGGAGATFAGLASCGRSNSASGGWTNAPQTFSEPRVLASSNGRLEVTLTARAEQVPFGKTTRFAFTFNGSTPGPTLRVKAGDTLVITLDNQLDEPTNLHTRGLHVSPEGESDNVFVRVDPGKSHTYTYVLPDNHRSSLCWYHPHHHGMVAPQLGGGLFGAIIVEDSLDDLPELAGSVERVLILSDPRIGDSDAVLDVSNMDVMAGREGDSVLINGLTSPIISSTAGKLERWRVLNASPSRYYLLAVDGHVLQVIGTDGGRLTRPVSVENILLAPGERTEFLMTPTTPGSYSLRTLDYDRGSAMMSGGMGGGGRGARSGSSSEAVLATMKVSGSATAAALPRRLMPPAGLDVGVARSQRPIEFAMGMGSGMGRMAFTINGLSFDEQRTDIEVRAGDTEDWVISNVSSMDHPFHLHAWPFQVIDRTSGPADLPGWKDTVNVPAGGTVTVRVPFIDVTGRSVFHCHILDHEDQGMMGIVDVR